MKTVNYSCDFCGQGLPNKRNQVHFAMHIGESGIFEKYDTCDECMIQFTNLASKMKQTSGGKLPIVNQL